jgi:hypothetical protein
LVSTNETAASQTLETEAMDNKQPASKRVKVEKSPPTRRGTLTRYMATALVGAVVGGVGAVAALAALPPDFFN